MTLTLVDTTGLGGREPELTGQTHPHSLRESVHPQSFQGLLSGFLLFLPLLDLPLHSLSGRELDFTPRVHFVFQLETLRDCVIDMRYSLPV